jgi:CubicO group peptidase (beta-lactamase class C family)
MNDLESLRGWLDDETAAHRFSGVALAWRDGGEVFSYAGGLASRAYQVSVTLDSRFGIASVTKMITAALRLVEAGLLSLDRPLIEVLPPAQQIASLGSDHSLHHVLSHTSALPNYFDDDDPTWASWMSSFDRVPVHHLRRPADMLPLFDRLPRVGAVGGDHRYCDTNFLVAGLAIEAATGQPFSDVAQQLVLEPAGMLDSGFFDLDTDPADLATGYLTSDDPPETWRSNIYGLTAAGMPDGGMIATAADLARFMEGLLRGRLVSPESLKSMITPHSTPGTEGGTYGYGFGMVIDGGRVVVLGHGGSDPGWRPWSTTTLASISRSWFSATRTGERSRRRPGWLRHSERRGTRDDRMAALKFIRGAAIVHLPLPRVGGESLPKW